MKYNSAYYSRNKATIYNQIKYTTFPPFNLQVRKLSVALPFRISHYQNTRKDQEHCTVLLKITWALAHGI